jgi:acyl carrier protein
MSDARTTIRDYILTECLPGQPADSLDDDAPLRTSGVLDSMASLKLVSFLEKQFGIEVDARDVDDHFNSVNDLVAFVAERGGPA